MGLDKFDLSLRNWVFPGILLGLSLLVALGGDDARQLFRFDRIWISEGESWRLVTGHLAHLGPTHFLLNAAGLLLIWFLVGSRYDNGAWWIVIALSIVAIDMGLWFLDGTLIWYVGLSGLLHGLLAAGILAGLGKPDGETLLLAALLVIKLGWEQIAGPVPGSTLSAGGPVVVNAHLYGAAGGIIGALVVRIRVKRSAAI